MRLFLSVITAMFFSTTSWALVLGAGHWELIDTHQSLNKPFMVIKLTGNIAQPLASEFFEIYKKVPRDLNVVIDLDSMGGDQNEGQKILEFIRTEKASGRKISTFVANGNRCGSMCVLLFVQGEIRNAGERSMFMFHGVTPALSNIPDEIMTNRMFNLFLDSGVTSEWLEVMKKRGVFTEPGEYWISGEELVQEKSNVVTKLLSRHVHYKPETLPIDIKNFGPH